MFLSRPQLDAARKVLRYRQHCSSVGCGCANCTALLALETYEKLLAVLEHEPARADAFWRAVRLAMELT